MSYLMRLISIVLLSFILVACSSKPSDSDIEKAVNEYIQRVMPRQQCLKIKNVEKINGIDRNNGTYQVMVRWDMVLEKDVDLPIFDCNASSAGSDFFLDSCGFLNNVSGKVCRSSADFVFTKTENGWQ